MSRHSIPFLNLDQTDSEILSGKTEVEGVSFEASAKLHGDTTDTDPLSLIYSDIGHVPDADDDMDLRCVLGLSERERERERVDRDKQKL
jgi:hypothetical protein